MSDQTWFFDIEILGVDIRLNLEVHGEVVTAGLDKSIIPASGVEIGSLSDSVTALSSKLSIGSGFSLAGIKEQIAPGGQGPFAGVIAVIDNAKMTLTDLEWVSGKSLVIGFAVDLSANPPNLLDVLQLDSFGANLSFDLSAP